MGRRSVVIRNFGREYAWRPSWKPWERLYVRVFGFVDLPGRLRARLILSEALAHRPRELLDFGCGTGCYSFFLSRIQEVRICGVDVDSTRIRDSHYILNRLQRKNLAFFSEDPNAPLSPLPGDSFDLALAVEVFQYLPNVQLAMSAIYRVLKPGGYLIGHVPVLGHLRPAETILFDDKKIHSMLADAGFQFISIKPTFGGFNRRLCAAYDRISWSRTLVMLLFPFFLFISKSVPLEAKEGDYRFFAAQKPKGTDDGTFGREERVKGE
jgi:SAM-dependent methyltransferase